MTRGPILNRRGTPVRPKSRKPPKVCPGCGARFHTRTKMLEHLLEAKEQADRRLAELEREHGVGDG